MIPDGLWLGIAAATLVAWGQPASLRLLQQGRLVRPNYRREEIPVAAGLFPALALALGAAILAVRQPAADALLPFGIITAAAVGLLDDAAGDRTATGLRGHLRALLAGRLSTGGLKAVVIAGAAIAVAAAQGRGPLWLVLDAALLALAANAINLLDVRPGRAVKAVLFLLILSAPAAWGVPYLADFWWLTVLVIAAYAPADLRAAAMLGDSGANALGFTAGWVMLLAWSDTTRLGALIAFVGFHAVSERTSWSEWIDKISVLKWLDRWGTKQ